MDFEPLWALGGWFLFPNCMAVPKTSSSISEIHTKSHPFVLFIAILFIFLLLINLSNPINPSMASSSVPLKRVLLDPSASATSTANLHPKQARNKPTEREFGAEAHEVPSGPNPISN
ncbi:hypothetical protein FH972_002561 [Carpinus fangiana]|uniref:Uncharacterized protein n=1 Tax=Carpinus fangiana TaxID=176857 RepID=A0A5N6QFS1_9ROSI|nr:hypothetical protein FH972_002561 [Carpinus fangiana]